MDKKGNSLIKSQVQSSYSIKIILTKNSNGVIHWKITTLDVEIFNISCTVLVYENFIIVFNDLYKTCKEGFRYNVLLTMCRVFCRFL